MYNGKLVNLLKSLENEFLETVTQLSKPDNGYFIVDDTKMISADALSKNFKPHINLSSVDAIYYYYNNDKLIINFFEFKNNDILDENKYVFNKIDKLIKDLESTQDNFTYIKQLNDIKHNARDKTLISLKDKPLESLFLLYELLKDDIDELHHVEKRYYVVSRVKQDYPDLKNKNISNNRRKSQKSRVYNFIYKITPYPFKRSMSITETTFKKMIEYEKRNR